MTKYYKQLNEKGDIITLLTYDFEPNITDTLCVEIAEDEYNDIRTEKREKRNLVNQLYRNEITLDAVPEEWQDEIQSRVDEIIAERGEFKLDERLLKAKAYDIITGVSE